VLIVRLDAGEYEIVGCGGIGRRIVPQHLGCQRIEPERRDRIVGERRAGRTGGVVNRSAEDVITEYTGALSQRRNHALTRDSGSQPGTLPGGKEKRFVFAEGAAHRQAVLVLAKLRPRAWLRKIIPGVEIFVAEELKDR